MYDLLLITNPHTHTHESENPIERKQKQLEQQKVRKTLFFFIFLSIKQQHAIKSKREKYTDEGLKNGRQRKKITETNIY